MQPKSSSTCRYGRYSAAASPPPPPSSPRTSSRAPISSCSPLFLSLFSRSPAAATYTAKGSSSALRRSLLREARGPVSWWCWFMAPFDLLWWRWSFKNGYWQEPLEEIFEAEEAVDEYNDERDTSIVATGSTDSGASSGEGALQCVRKEDINRAFRRTDRLRMRPRSSVSALSSTATASSCASCKGKLPSTSGAKGCRSYFC